MEVKTGYTKTEVGINPKDWFLYRIENISESVTSGRSRVDAEFGDYPVYGSTGIIGKCKKNSYFGKSILIARVGANAGSLYVVDGEYGVTDNTIIVKVRESYEFDYIWRQLESKNLNSMVFGSGQPLITGTQVKAILIPLPAAKAEQEAIAEALSDADALIESLEKLIAKKRLIKQGAMQELLTGKTRLQEFGDKWVVKRLEELAEIRSGGTPSTTQTQFWDGEVLWCTPTDITALAEHKYLIETSRKITFQGLKSSSAEMIPANSIVMTSRATIGECAINLVPVSTNQGFKNFIPFENVDFEFLYYLLLTKKNDFMSLCGGSTFLEISKNQLAIFEVRLPAAKAEQIAVAKILCDMDVEIAELKTKLTKARQIKQGMMQELLTGRIRLVTPATQTVPTVSNSEGSSLAKKAHNWEFNEAVVIAVLTKQFGSEPYPLARKRCTKLTYLFHRHREGKADGYLKKAAGPYNPATKYKGPEKIAQQNNYVRSHNNGTYPGFVASTNIAQAESYFNKWYGADAMKWLEQFHYSKTDELELIATVDMAMQDLRQEGKPVALAAVKQIIQNHPEWEAKLDRDIFSDDNITKAIQTCGELFPLGSSISEG